MTAQSNDRFSIRNRPGRKSWIDPTRYSVVQRFFLDRLERLVAMRRSPEPRLDRSQSRLLDHAIYSTYRDCVALELSEEAHSVLHDQEGLPNRQPSA